MRKVILCLASCLFSMFLAVSVHAQITIEIKDMPLTEALKKLEEQSGYSFFYSSVLPDKDALILVYCRSGRRSKIASEALANLGYSNVKEFGGIIDWQYDIVK